jgi:hypothetical protein
MRSIRHCLTLVAIAAMSCAAGGVAAEPVTFTKDAQLRSEARFDAKPVAQIKQGTAGDASGKQGPWLNIKTPQATGWALTTDITFGSGGGSSGGASLGGIFGGGKPQQVSGTSTLGVRGFDKETIGNALGDGGAVNDQQLALLDGYAASKDDGQSFASTKGLSATSISY